MAVGLSFISLIVPIEKIEEHYPGGFSQYKIDMRDSIGRRIWYDDYLVRDGAMNSYDIERLIEEWESYGLKGVIEVDGEDHWKDFCVVDFFDGATLPCNWLKSEGESVTHIKDNSKKVVGRDDMPKHFKTASENESDAKELRAKKYGKSFKIIDREFIEAEKSKGRIISVGRAHFLVSIEADGQLDITEIPFVETSMKDPYSETDKDLFVKASVFLERMYPASVLQAMPPIKAMNIEKWTEAVNNSPKTSSDKVKISDAMKVYSQPNETTLEWTSQIRNSDKTIKKTNNMIKKTSIKKPTNMTKMRGITNEFAEAFKKSDLYKLYKDNKDELFIGVRNNYLNLYYNCDSIAKIKYTRSNIWCEIDRYYLDGKNYKSNDKNKRYKIEQSEIIDNYETIKNHSENKPSSEKKAQSKLVLLNNENIDSNWFCVDVEYIKSFKNQTQKTEANFNARFDIIAISKAAPHRVALIELKYGGDAMGGKSGIYKHVHDFNMFCEKGYYENHLREEIVKIIESQREIGITHLFDGIEEKNLLSPEFYFITLDNNAKSEKGSTPKQRMAAHLFETKQWGCKKLTTGKCVESDFGDITKKDNKKFHATFLFSTKTHSNLNINDIIDGDYDERIPK